MKGLKKIALATAIAAAPFAANAGMKALDDVAMGNVTGQAGVTIELETKVDIGEFRYIDEGYLSVTNISLGGGTVQRDANGNVTGVSGLLDDLLINIDIEADGDAVIDVHSISGQPIDYAMAIGSVSLNSVDGSGDSTLLATNIGIEGQLGQLNIRVDTATDTLITNVGFNVTQMDMDIDFLGVNVRGMRVMGANFFEEVAASGQPTTAAGLFAFATITMGKATSVATGNEALGISIPNFAADIAIDAIEIGGASIGSIQMDNLVVSNTNMVIYGH
ncbi:MAG: DUF6160 family protein [Marinobacter sp.]|nr:DUF6160 family protein [Marinobacter sp.]